MENISVNPNLPQKRKHPDHQNRPSTPPQDTSKRPRLSSIALPVNMNNSVATPPKPRVVDLTHVSKFAPHKGAKRLVVKNLKSAPSQNVEDYYSKVWRDLDSALSSIFNGEQTSSPLEVLCRGVEATCRRGKAQELFVHLRDHSRSHMEKQLLPKIQADVGAGSIGALRTVHKYWKVWHKQTVSERLYLHSKYYNLTNHRLSSAPYSATSIGPSS